tara:strand:+ start:8981 stop:12016 length:3036 start_codon:yes stop_codon:yes gene_type:complete
MSRLIMAGDTTKNFGVHLPDPYVEQISISDTTSGYAYVDVEFNAFIKIGEEADEMTLIDELGDFTFYWRLFTLDSEGNALSGIWNLSQLLNNEISIWSLAPMGSGWGGASFKLSEMDYTVVYDEAGERTLKFVYSTSVNGAGVTLDTYIWGGSALNDVSVYLTAWCTPEEFEAPFWSYASATYDDNWGKFLNIETSGISYDVVWRDQKPAVIGEITWVDGDGNVYDDTPLQSVTSLYYTTDVVTHEEIATSFQDLLDEYKSQGETDESLQDIMDQISYILTVYGSSADLLSRLNELARAFPSKTSATSVGTLYNQYVKKVAAANTAITTSTQVYKDVIQNTKVVDLRGVPSLTWSDPLGSTYDLELDTDGETSKWANSAILTNMKIGRTLIWLDEDAYVEYESYGYISKGYLEGGTGEDAGEAIVINNYGYVFFDYDQTMYKYSYISDYVQMDTLFNVFGKEYLNKYFKLTTAEYLRTDVNTGEVYGDSSQMSRIITNFEDGYIPTTMTHQSAPYDNYRVEDSSKPYVYSPSNYAVAYSFVLLRNFAWLTEPSTDDDRLMCFEIQDFDVYTDYGISNNINTVDDRYYSTDGDTELKFYVTFEDSTHKLIEELISSYSEAKTALSAYVIEAGENCNFNTIDNRFKETFATAQNALYRDSIGYAPWVYYPVFYSIHRDIVTKEHGGNLEAIMLAAANISAKINPDYGTLEELQNFERDFNDLWSGFYDTGGTLAVAADVDTNTKRFWNSWTGAELGAQVWQYYGDIVNDDITYYDGTTEIESTEYESADNPSMIWSCTGAEVSEQLTRVNWDCATENSLRYTAAYTVNSAAPTATWEGLDPRVTILTYDPGIPLGGTPVDIPEIDGATIQLIAFDPGPGALIPSDTATDTDFRLRALVLESEEIVFAATPNQYRWYWYIYPPDGSGGYSVLNGPASGGGTETWSTVAEIADVLSDADVTYTSQHLSVIEADPLLSLMETPGTYTAELYVATSYSSTTSVSAELTYTFTVGEYP